MKQNIDKEFLSKSIGGMINWLTPIGIVLGVMLIIIALTVDSLFSTESVTLSNLPILYKQNPVHWIILTSPFFLGTIFFVMSRIIRSRHESLKLRAENEKKQFLLLETFITDLESGKLDTEIEEEFENRLVAQKLHDFRDKLNRDNQAEEERIWESQGLAEFAEILRATNDIDQLSEKVLKYIVKYVGVNQGSVFVADEARHDGAVLNMKACYAFDRKKHLTKSVAAGHGLVGQCYLEKETTVLHQVPQDYVKITSGLGTANPSFIIILPMISEEEATGVIELAGFKKLEMYQIKFLERAANAFATVVKSVITNANIKSLLAESQQQTEELRSQEEEMRQNLEELHATEEQLTRQLEENEKVKKNLEWREHVLSKTTILSESDLYGTITFVNSKFCEVSQYSLDELIGKGHNIVRHPDMPKAVFKLMWSTIKKGEIFRGIVKNRKKDGSPYWVDATIVPIFERGKIVKYIGARYHIQDEHVAEQLYAQQMSRLGLPEEIEMYN